MRRAGQRIALVVPFFASDARGAKDRFAYAYATHLALEGVAVEVITTTARPDAPGENYYRAGLDNTEPFPVHRFRVLAPDRAAYDEAVLAVRADRGALATHARALLGERLRSPDLAAHVRAVADRYDAFLCVDVSAATTVDAIAQIADQALVVPLLDDEPVVRLREVAEALAKARCVLCTTDAEASLLARLYGSALRAHVRTIGLAADVVPPAETSRERVLRATRGKPYVLVCGDDREAIEAIERASLHAVVLHEAQERDRAGLFAHARAVAVTGEGRGFVPEVVEAWAYGKIALVPASAPGAAALVRETGAGIVVPERDAWAAAIAALPDPEVLGALARGAAAFVESRGGWRGIVLRTSDAVDAMAALDDGRSREELREQIAYLYPLVQRQRRTIEAMRVSRFWRLRDTWFAAKRRFGVGPLVDPVPASPTDDPAVALAALGDPYQLFRDRHRLRWEDVQLLQAAQRQLRAPVAFSLLIDARGHEIAAIEPSLASLRDQLYERWEARVIVDEPAREACAARIAELWSGEGRIVLVTPGESRTGSAAFTGPLDPGDRLEPHALGLFALALADGDVDLAYSDEDVLDERGLPSHPWFKPDWSPETLLTRDVVGRAVFVRSALLEQIGGVRDALGAARWYDAVLRVTERSERVAHLQRVLVHRDPRNCAPPAELALAVEVALRRRGEHAVARAVEHGVDVRFGNEGERVCVIIPTRDRADLLGACLTSLFERTAYPNFEVIVVDNGSRETATAELFAHWKEREPERFSVLHDPSPFNYSRLNNAAVRATDAPYVVLLNNDTEVIAPDWMEAMLGQARRPQIGAVGALLLYPDETVQHGGVVLGILGLAGHAHRFLPASAAGYHGALQLDTNALAVTGACLMVSRRKYEDAGGLDESFVVAYNDVDFCLKLRHAGYRNVVVPRARLYHYESKSRGEDDTPAKVARAMEEVRMLRSRWPDWAVRDPYYNPNLAVDAEDFRFQL